MPYRFQLVIGCCVTSSNCLAEGAQRWGTNRLPIARCSKMQQDASSWSFSYLLLFNSFQGSCIPKLHHPNWSIVLKIKIFLMGQSLVQPTAHKWLIIFCGNHPCLSPFCSNQSCRLIQNRKYLETNTQVITMPVTLNHFRGRLQFQTNLFHTFVFPLYFHSYPK